MAPSPSGPVRVHVSGIIAVLTAAACWGASGIFVKLILASGPISPLNLAFWRDTAAFGVFFFLAQFFERGRIMVPRSAWPWLAAMGICLGSFHVVLNLGYLLNGAAITTVQQAAMPAIVMVAARIIWKEPLTGLKIFSLLLIGIGTLLVSGLLRVDGPNVTAGSILVGFCVPVFYAAWSLCGKKLRSRHSAVVTLTWAFGFATLVLLPFQLATGSLRPPPVSMSAILQFAGLIGISTVGAFFAFTFGLGRLTASIATILVMSEIAFAVLYARIFLREVLTNLEVAGALLVVMGVVVLATPRRGGKKASPKGYTAALSK
ncbi:MAG: DMT family transporter [Desulfobacterales bacterium]|jgi:drug/metabolite transporter, DME family